MAATFLLSGCLVQSKVQGRYVEDQSGCRNGAEENIGRYEQPGMTPQARNAQLVTLFADCMAKKGWQVAKPKRTTTAGPHGPLDPYSSAVRTTTTTVTNSAAAQQQLQQNQMQQQQLHQRQQQLELQQQQLRQQQIQMQQTPQSAASLSQQQQALTRQQQEVTAQQQNLQRQQLELQQSLQRNAASATTTTTTQQGVRAPSAATQAPVGQRPVETTTTPLSPSPSMPPLAKPTEAPAAYQPGRAYVPSSSTPYGSGAGRNF